MSETPMSDLNPLSQLEVEREILRLSRCLSALTTDITDAAKNAAAADVEYKVNHAQAYLAASGTVAERDAKATLAVEDQLHEKAIFEAVYRAQQETGRNLRAQLDALRTIAANVRDQVAHATGRGG